MNSNAVLEENVGVPASARGSDATYGKQRAKKGFGQKLKVFFVQFGLDWVTILSIGVIALMIDKYVPDVGGKARYFRLLPDGSPSSAYESLDHPYRSQIISFWISAALDVAVPLVVIALLELFARGSSTIVSVTQEMLGAVSSVITCCFFQIITKTIAGGFRPSFFEICKPNMEGRTGAGLDGTWYKSEICTGDPDKINWALESFPSGHVATSFAAAVYLSFYINAKLKVFADYRASPLMVIFCLGPLQLALLMCGAISADMSHHWYDILAGAILGSFIGFLTFRNHHAAVWDWRYNHIALSSRRRFMKQDTLADTDYDVIVGYPRFTKTARYAE